MLFATNRLDNELLANRYFTIRHKKTTPKSDGEIVELEITPTSESISKKIGEKIEKIKD